MKNIIIIVNGFLIFILVIFELCGDIKERQFITNLYIVLMDIIQIVAFVVLGYFSFMDHNKENIEAFLGNDNYDVSVGILAGIILLGTRFIKKYKKETIDVRK